MTIATVGALKRVGVKIQFLGCCPRRRARQCLRRPRLCQRLCQRPRQRWCHRLHPQRPRRPRPWPRQRPRSRKLYCIFCTSLSLHPQGCTAYFLHLAYPIHKALICILHISPIPPTRFYCVFRTCFLTHPECLIVYFGHFLYSTRKVFYRILYMSPFPPTGLYCTFCTFLILSV